MYEEFPDLTQSEFKMSLIGELRLFLGLYIKQNENGIFICQETYIKDLFKKYNIKEDKVMSTHMHPSNNLDNDKNGTAVTGKEYHGMIDSLFI